ncbi:MAG: hypothetical protein IJZ55_09065 [Lachnospiraceae bacterium]|nr:hypothetical protein [Lachnospiraceae bacterium]
MKKIKILFTFNVLLCILMIVAMWLVNNHQSEGLAALTDAAIFLLYFIIFLVVTSIFGLMTIALLLIYLFTRNRETPSDKPYNIAAIVWIVLLALAAAGVVFVLIWGTVLSI